MRPTDWTPADRDAVGRALEEYQWGLMQIPPDPPPDGWYPPRQANAAAVVRRGYEMTGAVLKEVRALQAEVAALRAALLPAGAARAVPLSFPSVIEQVYAQGGPTALAELGAAACARLALSLADGPDHPASASTAVEETL